MTADLVVHLIGSYLGWFACVLGAAAGEPLPGIAFVGVLVLLRLLWSRHKTQVLRLAAWCAALGFVLDTSFSLQGQFQFVGTPPLSVAPLWMVALWVNLSLTLPYAEAWIGKRWPLAALLGGFAAPLAYLAGDSLGAILLKDRLVVLYLAICWAGVFPFLIWLAGHTRGAGSHEVENSRSQTG